MSLWDMLSFYVFYIVICSSYMHMEIIFLSDKYYKQQYSVDAT